MIHFDTKFGTASIAVHASGRDVLVTLTLADRTLRGELQPEDAAVLAGELRLAAETAVSNRSGT